MVKHLKLEVHTDQRKARGLPTYPAFLPPSEGHERSLVKLGSKVRCLKQMSETEFRVSYMIHIFDLTEFASLYQNSLHQPSAFICKLLYFQTVGRASTLRCVIIPGLSEFRWHPTDPTGLVSVDVVRVPGSFRITCGAEGWTTESKCRDCRDLSTWPLEPLENDEVGLPAMAMGSHGKHMSPIAWMFDSSWTWPLCSTHTKWWSPPK